VNGEITSARVIYACPLDNCDFTHEENKGEWLWDFHARQEALDQALMNHLVKDHTWLDALLTLAARNRKIHELEQALTELKEKA
jgi:hypothetical protein